MARARRTRPDYEMDDPRPFTIELFLLLVDVLIVLAYGVAWVGGGLLKLLLAGVNAASRARGYLPEPAPTPEPAPDPVVIYHTPAASPRRPRSRLIRRPVRPVRPIPVATPQPAPAAPVETDEREALIEAFMQQYKFPRASAEQMADAVIAQRAATA